MKWSEAKRLRSNPSQGFITGIDTESKEEDEKRKRRQERFERDAKRERNRKRGRDADADEEEGEEEEGGEMKDGEDKVDAAAAAGKNQNGGREPLNPQQAYTNEKWLSKYRVDPKIGDEEGMDEGENSERKVPEKVRMSEERERKKPPLARSPTPNKLTTTNTRMPLKSRTSDPPLLHRRRGLQADQDQRHPRSLQGLRSQLRRVARRDQRQRNVRGQVQRGQGAEGAGAGDTGEGGQGKGGG